MLGQAFFLKGDYDQALSIFDPLMNNGFKNSDLFYSCAEIYLKKELLNKSEEMLDNVLDLKPVDKYKLSSAFVKIGKSWENLSNNEAAIKLYKKMQKIPETSESGALNEAKIQLKLNNIEKTLALISEIKNNSNLYPDAVLLQGDVYRALNDFKSAKKYYTKVIALDHNNFGELYIQAVTNIGQMFEKNKEIGKAISWYKKLSGVYPGKMYQLISLTYINLGQFNKALNICDSGFKIKILREQNPFFFSEIYLRLLDEYKKSGNKAMEIKISEKLLILNPWFVKNWQIIAQNLADFYSSNNKPVDTIRVCKIILKNFPENSYASFQLKKYNYLSDNKLE